MEDNLKGKHLSLTQKACTEERTRDHQDVSTGEEQNTEEIEKFIKISRIHLPNTQGKMRSRSTKKRHRSKRQTNRLGRENPVSG